MASATSSTPGRSMVIIVSLVTLLLVLVFVSAVQWYDGRHDVEHSAAARRSRLETRHVNHCGTMVTHKHLVRKRIIVSVVGLLVGFISGPVLFVLLGLAHFFIRDRAGWYRSLCVVIIFALDLIRRPEVYKAQLPVEREEDDEARFIATKKIKQHNRDARPTTT